MESLRNDIAEEGYVECCAVRAKTIGGTAVQVGKIIGEKIGRGDGFT